MKISTATPSDTLRPEVPARPPRRAKPATTGGEGTVGAAPAADRVELSAQASSLRTAEEANRVAGETRSLIAQNNREALVAQAVDVGRLMSLVG